MAVTPSLRGDAVAGSRGGVPLAWLAIYYYTADLVVKAPVTVGLFLTAFLIVAVISVATLLWQVNKASRINPSEVMKSE